MFTIARLSDKIESKIGVNPQDRTHLQIVFAGENTISDARFAQLGFSPVQVSGKPGMAKTIEFEGKNYANEIASICRLFPEAEILEIDNSDLSAYVVEASLITPWEGTNHERENQNQSGTARNHEPSGTPGHGETDRPNAEHDRHDDLSEPSGDVRGDGGEEHTGEDRGKTGATDGATDSRSEAGTQRGLHADGGTESTDQHGGQRSGRSRDFTNGVSAPDPIAARIAALSNAQMFVPNLWREYDELSEEGIHLWKQGKEVDDPEYQVWAEKTKRLKENPLVAKFDEKGEIAEILERLHSDKGMTFKLSYAITRSMMARETVNIVKKTLEGRDGEVVMDPQRLDEVDRNILAGMSGLGNASDYLMDELYQKMVESGIDPSRAASALRTTNLTAMFTPYPMADFLWQMVQSAGFKGGHVVEYGCGTGRFVGTMPMELRDKTAFTGVEKDPVTTAIARVLYPEQTFINEALENLPKDSIEPADVIVGNIPFGDVKVFDSEKGASVNIHHYFMDRILDTVKPGGIVAIYNSVWVMEAKRSERRKEIARQAELLGVVRMDDSLISNAEMGAIDLLILKKRETPLPETLPDDQYPDWVTAPRLENEYWTDFIPSKTVIEQGELPGDKPFFVALGEKVILNFANLPAGAKAIPQGRFYEESITSHIRKIAPILGKTLDGAYAPKTVQRTETQNVPKRVVREALAEIGLGVGNIIKEGDEYFLIDHVSGQQFIAETPVPVKGKKASEQMDALIALRKAAYEIIRLSSDIHVMDEQVESAIKEASDLYDQFVVKHGPINELPARHPIRLDIAWAVLSSCEKQIKNEHGEAQWQKSEFLQKRVIAPPKTKERYETPSDALLAAYSETAMQSVAPWRALELLGEPIEQMDDVQVLSRFFDVFENEAHFPFYNPDSQLFEHPDFYLSGNVREKRSRIERIRENDPSYFERFNLARNLEALNQVVPKDITWEELDVPLGVPWIDQDIYKAFIIEVGLNAAGSSLATSGDLEEEINLIYDPDNLGGWRLEFGKWAKGFESSSDFNGGGKRFRDIFTATMNGQKMTIKRKYEDGTVVLDEADTATVRERQEALERAWAEWLVDNPTYRNKILKRYNEEYRSTIPYTPRTPIEHIDGMSTLIELRPHQKAVVTRSLAQKNLLMAHGVGAGKTMAMVASIMAARSYGLVSRPMLVVKKSTIGQIASEAQRLFPSANILVMDSAKTTGKDKATFIGQLVTGHYDFSIVTYETFKSISFSPEEELMVVEREKAELKRSLAKLDTEGDDKKTMSFSQKRVLKRIEALDARLKKLRSRVNKEARSPVYYDDLGIDMLIFDEAHTLKNVTVSSKENALSKSGSQIADDALLKINWSRRKQPNFRLIFSTGTPISNSFTEMYGLMRFLAPDVLKKHFGGASHVGDGFFKTFTRPVTEIDMGVDGQYKERTRIDLINVPELANLFRTMADVVFVRDTNIERPDVEREHCVAPVTDLHQVFQGELIQRAEKIKDRLVDPTEDNYLKLATNGRDMANDPRLLIPEAPEKPEYKVNLVVQNVLDIHFDDTQGVEKKTQAIFLDSGTPGSRSYDLYNLIKQKLVAGGISEDEIAFIHDAKTDAQRAKLFERVRDGEIRVIIGSTEKMGVGVNMQTRLYALHHFDVPRSMRPSDVEQREGRILRQGNLNKRIKMFYYTTEGSFDVFTWNLVRKKQEMIEKIMSTDPDNVDRQIEDEGDGADYASIVEATTGSSSVKALAQIERQLKTLSAKMAGREKEVRRMRMEKIATEKNIEILKEEIAEIENAMAQKQAYGAAIVILDDNGNVAEQFNTREGFSEYLKAFKRETLPRMRAETNIPDWQTFETDMRLLVHGAPVRMKAFMESEGNVRLMFKSDLLGVNMSQFWALEKRLEQFISMESVARLQKDIVKHEERVEQLDRNMEQALKESEALEQEKSQLEEQATQLRDEVDKEIQTFLNKQKALGASTLEEYVRKHYGQSQPSRLADVANDVQAALDGLNEKEQEVSVRVV